MCAGIISDDRFTKRNFFYNFFFRILFMYLMNITLFMMLARTVRNSLIPSRNPTQPGWRQWEMDPEPRDRRRQHCLQLDNDRGDVRATSWDYVWGICSTPAIDRSKTDLVTRTGKVEKLKVKDNKGKIKIISKGEKGDRFC